MAFVLTLIYVAFSLLSPAVLPEAIMALHVNIILGIATILVLIPQVAGAKLGDMPDSYLVAGLLFAAAVSVLPLGFSAVLPKVMDYLPIFIVFFFVAVGCRSIFQLKVMIYVLVGVALFIFSQGAIADRAHDVMSHYLVTEGTGDDLILRYKGLGVLSDPNDLAQFFVTLIPLLWIRWKPGSYLANLLFTIVPACLLCLGMYFTHSRGGVVALIAVILFGFKNKLGYVLSAILAAGLFVGLVALNVSGGRGMNDDDGGRVAAWSTGLELFRTHPLIGVGIDQFPNYNETGHTAHNSYILALSEVGLLGYFCWMGMIVSNLSELGLITRLKALRDSGTDGLKTVVLPPHLAARAAAATTGMTATRKESASFASSGFGRLAYQGAGFAGAAPRSTWSPVAVRVGQIVEAEDPNSDERLQYIAKVIRVSFVGLLTSAFFLSRSFSMVFYIVLGMSATLRLIYRTRHPEAKVRTGLLMKRIALVVAGSIVFLYLFVRIRGLH